jgi:glycosyltransferase involved in cell wall biosynthesis
MQSTPFVSVVTPFYNTREFLSECIESVLRQTYQNWEYILVDNCSTDGSSELAEDYAFRFRDKIRLIRTQSLLSQVQNYNFALTRVSPRSTYCKMVQADDWIFPDCIRSMVEVAEAHPSVGIVGAYELDGNEVRLDGLPYPSPQVSGREVCRLYFSQGKYLFGTPTSLLMRSDLIRLRNPFYEERYAPFEDSHVCFDLLRSWNFGFVHQVLTYSRRDNGGIYSRVRQLGLLPFVHLATLVLHGRDHLSKEEYDRYLRRAEKEYFLYLAKNACALHREGGEFWESHRTGLESIGYSLSWKRLARWLPRAIVEKLWGAFWRRLDGDGESSAFMTHTNGNGLADRSVLSILCHVPISNNPKEKART